MTMPKLKTPPKLEGVDSKIATAERRLEYLQHKLANVEYSTTSSASFDRAEVAMLSGALILMRWYREVVR